MILKTSVSVALAFALILARLVMFVELSPTIFPFALILPLTVAAPVTVTPIPDVEKRFVLS